MQNGYSSRNLTKRARFDGNCYTVTLDTGFQRQPHLPVAPRGVPTKPNLGAPNCSTPIENLSPAHTVRSISHVNRTIKCPQRRLVAPVPRKIAALIPLAVGWGRFSLVAYKRLILSMKPNHQQVFGLFQVTD
ncbi:unnamed protein product [Bubo scandiacus]